MVRKGLLRDIVIVVIVVLFLVTVLPMISSLLRYLVGLQFLIVIGAAAVIVLLIQRNKRKH